MSTNYTRLTMMLLGTMLYVSVATCAIVLIILAARAMTTGDYKTTQQDRTVCIISDFNTPAERMVCNRQTGVDNDAR